MKLKLIIAVMIFLCLGRGASAHRLDEYLQATLISVEKDHVEVSMRMIPGVSVASSIIASIDSNKDGVISSSEQKDYATRVLSDLSLAVDDKSLKPKLVSVNFPLIEQIKEGIGEIQIEFTADVPSSGVTNRRLVLENHHQNQNAAYLVNCLAPSDHDIRIVSQKRNEQQAYYELDYVQAGPASDHLFFQWWANIRGWMSAVGIGSVFHLGMRHIAEGTDHLLFLLALLLPAPLIAVGSRWAAFASVQRSLFRICKIVTAFTIGHSITLALAASGVVNLPSRPIEVMIAVSILVSAIHAIRPLFPGKENVIAAFFGLIHGLAFASTISDLGLDGWNRVACIAAFNLGIETTQLMVVAATLPSLILLSRKRSYWIFRYSGAIFAAFASIGWIIERLLNVNSSIDAMMDGVAHHAILIAGFLLFTSLTYVVLPIVFGTSKK
ncbi:MAG: HupE/UreJ family protein [Rhizonema sp. PD37]|nr:HupE/UreJ family protein [Rhizonema sp. PD37]